MKILLIVFLVTVNVNAEEAGWIGSFDGKSEHFVLERGDETIPVTPLTGLLVGDEITIKDKNARIQLMLQGGNKLVEVTYKNSIFRITEDGKVPSPLDKFWKSVRKFLHYWYKSTPENTPPTPAGLNKGDEKQLPNIAWLNRKSRLVAGKRSLLLQWQNGKPTFKVKVTHKETVLWEGTTENSWIMTGSINFEAKKFYRVTVTDSESKNGIRGFKAVTSDKDDLDCLLQNNNKWGFEISQRLIKWR